MNEMQRCQQGILRAFVEICHVLGLQYYLVCGSALGAVKYQGFIPWDDDIDVALPREDYEIFLNKAPRLLPKHLFLQNYRTDPAFPAIYSKLRDSRTTCVEENAAHLPIHHGIGIDIFPLDGYPVKRPAQWLLEIRKRWYLHLLGTAFAPPEKLRSRLEYRFKRLLGLHRHTAAIAARYDAMLRKYPAEHARLWCSHGSWQETREYAPREQYGEGIPMLFEGLTIRVPQDYHAYLTQKYGDYTREPPKESQVSHHRYAVLDCQRPYTDLLKNGKG